MRTITSPRSTSMEIRRGTGAETTLRPLRTVDGDGELATVTMTCTSDYRVSFDSFVDRICGSNLKHLQLVKKLSKIDQAVESRDSAPLVRRRLCPTRRHPERSRFSGGE